MPAPNEIALPAPVEMKMPYPLALRASLFMNRFITYNTASATSRSRGLVQILTGDDPTRTLIAYKDRHNDICCVVYDITDLRAVADIQRYRHPNNVFYTDPVQLFIDAEEDFFRTVGRGAIERISSTEYTVRVDVVQRVVDPDSTNPDLVDRVLEQIAIDRLADINIFPQGQLNNDARRNCTSN